jgi:adenylyl-sulfate kinase
MKVALVVWFTGLSGAGKSTIARLAVGLLQSRGLTVETVDGDDVRRTVTPHLGYNREDILENNRMITNVCAERRGTCDVMLVPVISPFLAARKEARRKLGEPFLEVYVRVSLATVSRRDPKGLYARASQGKIPPMIGISSDVPYETPEMPDLVLDTQECEAEELAVTLVDLITTRLPRTNNLEE